MEAGGWKTVGWAGTGWEAKVMAETGLGVEGWGAMGWAVEGWVVMGSEVMDWGARAREEMGLAEAGQEARAKEEMGSGVGDWVATDWAGTGWEARASAGTDSVEVGQVARAKAGMGLEAAGWEERAMEEQGSVVEGWAVMGLEGMGWAEKVTAEVGWEARGLAATAREEDDGRDAHQADDAEADGAGVLGERPPGRDGGRCHDRCWLRRRGRRCGRFVLHQRQRPNADDARAGTDQFQLEADRLTCRRCGNREWTRRAVAEHRACEPPVGGRAGDGPRSVRLVGRQLKPCRGGQTGSRFQPVVFDPAGDAERAWGQRRDILFGNRDSAR